MINNYQLLKKAVNTFNLLLSYSLCNIQRNGTELRLHPPLGILGLPHRIADYDGILQ
jgi:hypothetical protein